MIITLFGVQQSRFDDLDLISKSKECQNDKLQILFIILSTAVSKVHGMVATHIKEIKHSTLCVPGVCLRDTTNTFSPVVHLNVSQRSICSSCFS